MNYKSYTFLFIVILTGLVACENSAKPQSSKKGQKITKSQRMKWWRNAEFGMFIHWGIYAVPAHAEWYMNNGHVPRKKYEKYASQFDPVQFDANYWVSVAKEAGMKYLVITSKHHDGFCMFRTTATHYNVVDDTPWHKDPLKALSKACRAQGIKFGVYYSIMDWHSPDQLPHDDSNPQHPTYNPTRIKPGKKADYIKYMKTELHELITQYDPAILWFDGEWPSWWKYEDGKKLYDYLRKLKPDLIINNRVGKRPSGMKGIQMGKKSVGDYGTPEQNIPPNGIPGSFWETCMTINHDWGYNKADHDFKSDTTLIHNLVDIASKGGNYLLNVGPTAKGVIPSPEITRLIGMGHWLKTYGKAIYTTRSSPFKEKFSWGRVTQAPNKLYLEIFHWPKNGRLTLPAYSGSIASAHLMGAPNRAGVSADNSGNQLVVNLPGKAPNGIASVVEIDFTSGAM